MWGTAVLHTSWQVYWQQQGVGGSLYYGHISIHGFYSSNGLLCLLLGAVWQFPNLAWYICLWECLPSGFWVCSSSLEEEACVSNSYYCDVYSATAWADVQALLPRPVLMTISPCRCLPSSTAPGNQVM